MINLEDGLDFDEVLEVARWADANRWLKPELHDRLLKGANAVLSVVQNPLIAPWIGMIPGIGSQISDAVDFVRLGKTVLEVPPR